MVEVFKTDVTDSDEALILIERIHHSFDGYKANFDLQDCDNILRIYASTGVIHCTAIINFLKNLGCHAEILPDVIPALSYSLLSESNV
jgi:hypothetical protein